MHFVKIEKNKIVLEGLIADWMFNLTGSSVKFFFKCGDEIYKPKIKPFAHKKYDTYEKMTGRLRSFIHVRYKWIDDQLN